MYEAHRLLLDEQMYVNEVADLVGYKHPHHFTAAFKRKFGIMPKELKK
jgi:AraC-like DNA-binding protein